MFRRGLNFLKPFDWAAIVGSALVVAFCLLVLVPWEKQPRAQPGEQYQTCEYYRANGSAPPGLFNGLGCWIDSVKDDLEATSTLMVALFTIVLAFSTIGLWRQTDRLAEGAERQYRQTERAFISIRISPAVPADRFVNAAGVDVITVSLECRNNGTTPARRGFCHASWGVFGDDGPESTNFEDRWSPGQAHIQSQLALGPKDTTLLDVLEIPIGSIAEHRVFIWAWLDYDDIFDATRRHRTEYCCRIIIIPQNLAQMVIRFETYRMHNGYDDDCYRKPAPYEQPA